MVHLARGANHPLPSDRIEIRLSAPRAVDVLGLLVDADFKANHDEDLVFWNAPSTPGLSWVPGTPATLVLDPGRLPDRVSAVLVVLALPDEDGAATTFADVPTADLVLDGGTSAPAVHVPLSGLGAERAVIGAEVYRRGNGWKVRAVVQGYAAGLAELLVTHGVAVDDPEPPPSADQQARTAPPPPPPISMHRPDRSRPASGGPDGAGAAPSSSPISMYRPERHQRPAATGGPPGTPAASGPSGPSSGPGRQGYVPSANEVDYAERAWLIWEDAARAVAAYRSSTDYSLTVRDNELAGRPQRTSSTEILRLARQRLDDDVAQLAAELTATADLAPAAMADWTSPHWLTWRPTDQAEPGILVGHLGIEEAPQLRLPLILRRPWARSLWVGRGPMPGDSVAFGWSLVTRYLAALPAGSVAVEVIDPSGMGGLDWLHSLPAPIVQGVLAGGVASGRVQAAERLGQLLDIVDLRAIGADEDAAARSGSRVLRLVVVLDPAVAEFDETLVSRLMRLTEDGPRLGVATLCIETDTGADESIRMIRIRQSGTSLPSGSEETLGDPWVRSSWSFTPALLPDAGSVLRGPAGSPPALLRQMLSAQQEAGT